MEKTAKKPRTWKFRLIAVLFGLILALILAEIVCQIVARPIFREWDALLRDPKNFYDRSDDPVLVYGLRPNWTVDDQGHHLHINRQGIRDETDGPFTQPQRIGLIGDSVAFGLGVDVDKPISHYLQQALDPAAERLKILNLGVPGYGLREMATWMRKSNAMFHPQTVVYLFNLNDFALRDTIYEGADDALYRKFHRPTIKLPWFIGKALYRMHKGKGLSSPEWLSWTYEGTKDRTLPYLLEMSREAHDQGQHFIAVILPCKTPFQNGVYKLDGEVREITDFMSKNAIENYEWHSHFASDPAKLLDDTDHLTDAGFKKLTQLLLPLLMPASPASQPVK